MPLAALAAIAGFAAFEADPTAGAESAYLGWLAAAVLLAVAALAPPPAAELGLGAALVTAAVWALPAGPGRGAAVLALLVAVLGVATGRRLLRPLRPSLGSHAAVAAALCFGWQVLLRGELLFAPGHGLRPWAALLALPLAAGAALALLWRRHGAVPALSAATVAAVLAPGWTVATTLGLLALAGGSALAKIHATTASDAATADCRRVDRQMGADGVVAGIDTPAGAGRRARGEWRIWRDPENWPAGLRPTAGLFALLLPVAWEPRSGWAAALAGLAVWRPGIALGLAVPLGLAARFAPLPGALAPHASWREGVQGVEWLILLLPAVLVVAAAAPLRGSRRALTMAAAAALLAFATPWLPDRSAVAAPLALAALAIPAGGIAAGLTALWSAAILAGTSLLASYPWLRADPLGDAVRLLGAPAIATGEAGLAAPLAIGGGAAILLGLTAALSRRWQPQGPASRSETPAGLLAAMRKAFAGPRSRTFRSGPRRRDDGTRAAAWAAGVILFAALVTPRLARPATALLGAGSTLLLDRGHPSWYAEIAAQPSRAIVLETSMVHAAALASGTPVARVRLLGTGVPTVEVLLRAGRDTGDWAARRADVAAVAPGRSPAAWLRWVAGDFFGQRYRAVLRLPRRGSFARLEIDLASGLPADAGLAVHQVELEP